MTIDKVVRRICLLRDDPGAKNYVKTAAAASQAIVNLQLSSFPYLSTKDYVLDNSLSIPIEDGVAVVGKVGILKGSGIAMCREIDTIGLNFRKTEIDRQIECEGEEQGVVASDSQNQPPWNTFLNYSNTDGTLGELYGFVPGDNRPCYKVDYRGCRIIFNSTGVNIGDVVIVEASLLPGYGNDDEITIPIDAFDMVYHMASAYLDDYKNFSLAQGRRIASGSAKRIYDKRHIPMSLEDIYIYYRNGYNLSPSRG
jgi:hypothetical protein